MHIALSLAQLDSCPKNAWHARLSWLVLELTSVKKIAKCGNSGEICEHILLGGAEGVRLLVRDTLLGLCNKTATAIRQDTNFRVIYENGSHWQILRIQPVVHEMIHLYSVGLFFNSIEPGMQDVDNNDLSFIPIPPRVSSPPKCLPLWRSGVCSLKRLPTHILCKCILRMFSLVLPC